MFSDIPIFHIIFQLTFSLLALFFLVFDFILFLMTLSHRNDNHFPVAYLIVMTVCGVVCKIAFLTDFLTYQVFSELNYLEYRQLLGKEFTLLGTLTYFIPMCVSVLMTLNRLFVVVRPTDLAVFSQKRILIYSFGISILCLTLLLIPYFSTCSVNFLASTLEFHTGCAPDRHPVTIFTNTHLIWIPTTLLLINITLLLHLKAVRHSTYSKILQKSSTVSLNTSVQLAQSQKKREQVLMRQTLSITVYLSFYEVGSFLIRTFPIFYSNLPEHVRDVYFYFRLETICAINFFVYFMESASMRKLFWAFLGFPDKKLSVSRSENQVAAQKVSTITLRI